MDKKSAFGLKENVAAALAYAGMFITGIIILVVEQENKFVRFCALQSTILFGAWAVITACVSFVLGFIPFIGPLISGLISMIGVAAWVYLSIMAYFGKEIKIPVLGDAISEHLNK